MYLLIEKIEGPWATIEWGKDSFTIPKFLLPVDAKQGDKISIEIQLRADSMRLRRERPASFLYDDLDQL